MPVSVKQLSGYQAGHGLLCEELRGWLVNTLEHGDGAQDGNEPTRWRECAVVYSLLREHAIDQKGRCRRCRCPRAVFRRRRRRCQVHVVADFYLRQPEEFVRSYLTGELDGSTSRPVRRREASRGAASWLTRRVPTTRVTSWWGHSSRRAGR